MTHKTSGKIKIVEIKTNKELFEAVMSVAHDGENGYR